VSTLVYCDLCGWESPGPERHQDHIVEAHPELRECACGHDWGDHGAARFGPTICYDPDDPECACVEYRGEWPK